MSLADAEKKILHFQGSFERYYHLNDVSVLAFNISASLFQYVYQQENLINFII